MKIGIDCRLAGTKHAGIGRYTENLLQNLLQINSKVDWVLFFYSQEQADDVLKEQLLNKHVQVVITPFKHYSLEEQTKLLSIFKAHKLDLLHVPHFNIPIFYNKKLVVTIHDLLWHEYKGGNATTLSPIKYFLKYIFYKIVTFFAVTKANKIIVPAKTVKDTIIRFYPKAKDKIIITKEGGKIWNQKIKQGKKLKKTLLYVGSLYPHKNIKLVLRSLLNLPEYELQIVGSRNVFRDKVETFVKYLGIEDRVKFLGHINDQELAELYSTVTALVQPSFSEGFGLTGVEAMELKTPILASDIPIFNEIYQDVAYYFSPHSESSFINSVHQLDSDLNSNDPVIKKATNEKLDRGVNLAKTYDWHKMALKTFEIYNDI